MSSTDWTILAILVGIAVTFTATGRFAFAIGIAVWIGTFAFLFWKLGGKKLSPRLRRIEKQRRHNRLTTLNIPSPPPPRPRDMVLLFWEPKGNVFVPCDIHSLEWNSMAMELTTRIKLRDESQENYLNRLLNHLGQSFIVATRANSAVNVALVIRSSGHRFGEFWETHMHYEALRDSDAVQTISNKLKDLFGSW